VRADRVRELRDRCADEGVAFFFKQWGGARSKSGERVFDSRTWDQLPAQLGLDRLALPATASV
jgi:protein gp37